MYRFAICATQVSVYAIDKFEVTNFVAENLEVFRESFIISDSNDEPVKDLFKFSDVYNQITHVVESVSDSISKVCMYCMSFKCSVVTNYTLISNCVITLNFVLFTSLLDWIHS